MDSLEKELKKHWKDTKEEREKTHTTTLYQELNKKEVKNMTINENIELRLTLTQEDPLYRSFSDIKKSLGIKSNSEVARFIIKQISKIPVSSLILDLMGKDADSVKKIKAQNK